MLFKSSESTYNKSINIEDINKEKNADLFLSGTSYFSLEEFVQKHSYDPILFISFVISLIFSIIVVSKKEDLMELANEESKNPIISILISLFILVFFSFILFVKHLHKVGLVIGAALCLLSLIFVSSTLINYNRQFKNNFKDIVNIFKTNYSIIFFIGFSIFYAYFAFLYNNMTTILVLLITQLISTFGFLVFFENKNERSEIFNYLFINLFIFNILGIVSSTSEFVSGFSIILIFVFMFIGYKINVTKSLSNLATMIENKYKDKD